MRIPTVAYTEPEATPARRIEMSKQDARWLNLPSLGLSMKVLFSGYLLAIGLGLLMAGAQILLTHGMADGRPGLSHDDIVYSYYGNRTGSTLEKKLNGSMKDKAPPEVRAELIKWVRAGAPEAAWEPHIRGLFQQYCFACHGHTPGLADFRQFEHVKQRAQVDKGITISSLTRVSHIHLFGIAFIFMFVGLIFSLSVGIPRWLKLAALASPFAFLILDFASWWLTKFDPRFAWITMAGGVGYTLASTFMWFTSLYQMWWLPRKGPFEVNAWRDE